MGRGSESNEMQSRNRNVARLTVGLCFLVALLEGYDIQAAGVAAPGLARALGLQSDALGLFFSASTIGMLIGASVGGWLADRKGRKTVLLVAVALFGLFSLGTAWAASLPMLVMMRALTGLGMGAALPVLITLAAESSPHGAARAVALMYAGTPIGGALAGVSSMAADRWQTIFLWGGLLPLLVLPALALWLKENPAFAVKGKGRDNRSSVPAGATFAQGRWGLTLLLWCAFLASMLVFYLMLNWTPMLLAQKGLSRNLVGFFQATVNISGALALLFLSPLLSGRFQIGMATIVYGMIVAGLVMTAWVPPSLVLIIVAAMVLGAGLLMAQAVLYATGPRLYPAAVRATGTGAAVAVGRIGSVLGPVIAGAVLSVGVSPGLLLLLLVPVVVVAMIANLGVLTGVARRHPDGEAGQAS